MEKLRGIFTEHKLLILTFIFALCMALGGVFVLTNRETDVTPASTEPVAIFRGGSVTETSVGYVPKVTYPNGEKEETDFEATIAEPKVVVKVNGQEQKFDLISNEKQKFEDGKVVLTQESTLKFDITVPDRNELMIYAQSEVNQNGKLDNKIGIEKKNGKFHYGGTYSLNTKDYEVYTRYDLLKVYTSK